MTSYIIILALITYLSWRKDGSILSPSFVFSMLWLLIVFLYSLNLVGYNDIDPKTGWFIILGVFSFVMGCAFSPAARPRFTNFEINIKTVLLLQVISILVYLPDAIESATKLLSGMTLEELRSNMDFGTIGRSGGTNGVLAIFKNLILTPFMFLSYPLVSYIFISGRNDNRMSKCIMYLEILIIAISIVRLGDRIKIFYLLFNFFTIYYLLKKRRRISSRVRKSIPVLFIITILSFIYTSISRGIEDVPMSFYSYLTCCVPLFDSGVHSASSFTFGALSFAPPIMLTDSFWRILGGSSLGALDIIYSMLEKTQEAVIIGDGVKSNAFYSLFYWFYSDFGVLGIALMSFIYGMVSEYFFKVVSVGNSALCLITFSLILQGVAFSFIRYQFSTNFYFYSFLIIPLLIKRIR